MNRDVTGGTNEGIVDGVNTAGLGQAGGAQAGTADAGRGPSGSDVETVSAIPSTGAGANVGRPANTFESQASAVGMTDGQIRSGVEVFDAGGETVGNVLSYDQASGSFVVRHGWLFGQDTEFSAADIGDTSASGIYLRQTMDELRQRYSDRLASNPDAMPPQTGAATATGAYDVAATQTVQPVQTVQQPVQQATTTQTATGDIRVPVYEEELVVGTRREEEGRVHLHKEVVTEQESVPVTLRQEQVTVERVPVDQTVDVGTVRDAFTNTDIEVPVMGEEAVVTKRAREVEEVRLRKQEVAEQQTVTDTVRRERVVVDGVEQGGTTMNQTGTTLDDTTR